MGIVGGLLFAACARPGAPPGGAEDRLPPLVVETEPDTFAVVDEGRRAVRFRFSERISERPSSGLLEDAVRVSPATGRVRVEHDGRSLRVRMDGGFRPDLVYRVTVQPVVQDLFNNTMTDAFELVFSTGGEFHPTLLAGRVVDRITGEPVRDVQVRAVSPTDSLVHRARGDSAGIFALRYLPPDEYQLNAYQDRNRNDSVDFSEPQGTRRVILGMADTVVIEEIALLAPDTTPPVLASADPVDSLSLELTFDDYLDPEVSLEGVEAELVPDSATADTVPMPAVEGVYHPWVLDSLRQARADSAARAEGEEVPEEDQESADGPETQLPRQTARVLLMSPLQPGATYRVEVSNVTNIFGTPEGGGSVAFDVPEAAPPDTAAADSIPEDSVGAQADTTGAPSDTTDVPPDTTGTPPDTTRRSPGPLRLYRKSPFRRPLR